MVLTQTAAWMVLVVAGLMEIVWSIGMKYSEGFTRLGPSIVTFVAAGISFWLLAAAVKVLPIGTAYAA
jgi:quaternary ammonium compound-resistance protein SugE